MTPLSKEMATPPPSVNSRTSNETRNLVNNGSMTVPVRFIPQTPVQRAGSVIFNPLNLELYYSDGIQWQQIIASPNGNVLCISDSNFDTTICADTDPETNSDTIFMRTAGTERVTIDNVGAVTETLLSKDVTTVDDINHTSTDGNINLTAGNITRATRAIADGNNTRATRALICDINFGVDLGDIQSSSNAGNITQTTGIFGGIFNTVVDGNITNTSTNDGNITNTTSNAGDITNTTVDGDITNTTTNDGNITNTSTNGDITNTSMSGDICTTANGGTIKEIAQNLEIIVTGKITEEAEEMEFSVDEGMLFAGGADWCANFLTGFIKGRALGYLVDTVQDAIITSAAGNVCFIAPVGAIKSSSATSLIETTGDAVTCAGGSLRSKAMPGGNVMSKAMTGGNVMSKAIDGCILMEASAEVLIEAGGPDAVTIVGGPMGGPANVNGGTNPSGPGGPVNIVAGPSSNPGSPGGPVNITGGTNPTGPGGPVNIVAGPGSSPSSPGGPVNITGGINPSGPGGPVNINSGPSAPVNITADGDDAIVNISATGGDNCGVLIETTGNNNKGITLSAPLTTIAGNLTVTGDTITVNTETVNVEDNCLYMNNAYTVPTGMGGCIVFNYLPTSNVATVDTGGFTEGVMGVSNPTVAKTNSHTFSVGDLVQISGSANPSNSGLFEVLSDTGTLLTIKGIGTVATSVDFVQTQFQLDATVAGEIRQVNVRTIGSSSTGEFITTDGNNTNDASIANPDPVMSSIVPGTGISVDDTDPSNPIVSADGVQSVTAGTGVIVDNTDPTNPIVSTDGSSVQSVTAGPGIDVDDTDPANPIVNNDGVITLTVVGPGLTIDNSDPQNLDITNDGVLSVTAGDGITVDNSDAQNPIVLSNPLTKTRCTYHWYNNIHYDVDFNLGTPGVGPVLWTPPATLYEENNIVVNTDGRIEMSGASISPTMVLITWFVNGDFVALNNNNVDALMWVYKNGNPIVHSIRRFVDPHIEIKFIEETVQPLFPFSITYEERRQYTEGQASGSLVTELENGDIIDLRGGLVEATGPVTDRELFNYSITITEL